MEPITGIKHPAFREAAALTRPIERQRTGCYLVETANFVRQALRSTSEVMSVFAVPEEAERLRADCAARDIPLYSLNASLLNRLVGTGYDIAVTAIAVARQKLLTETELPQSTGALMLAGERIQDPRNVGVLVRTAEAAGCDALILTADSAEPFSRAAVRSSTGSIVRLPLCLVHDLPSSLRRLSDLGVSIVAGSAHAPGLVYDTALYHRPMIVLVGNESEGLSEPVRAMVSECVAIPMAEGGPSSLNVTVAAGILLYEAIRQGMENRARP